MGRSRRVDGKPETKADKKFFDLRGSGYKGPINQNGDMVTSGREAEILGALAQIPDTTDVD